MKNAKENAAQAVALVAKQAQQAREDIAKAAAVAIQVLEAANKTSANQDFLLGQQISEMKGTMVANFTSVIQRLDVSNGRLGKHDELFNKILNDERFQAGTRKGLSVAWKILLSIVTLAVAVWGIIAGAHLPM